MTSLIIGAGVSGYGAAALLVGQGRRVRVSERSQLPPEEAKRFLALGAELCDGGHLLTHLDQVDQVVVSPGVPQQHPLLRGARERGLEIISEIDLALRYSTARLIAVTGTNGKSTTCAMIGHLLAGLGLRASVGGNFGDPPTLMLAQQRLGDYLVLELSSYQLETSALLRPEAAIYTSFSHDHIARHGSLEAYFAAKWRLFAHLPAGALAIIPDAIYTQAKAFGFTLASDQIQLITSVEALRDLAPPQIHEPQNRLNAGFALSAIAHLVGKPAAQLAPLLATFRGLPHRCERIGTIAGHPVINDSKSTNVESTLVALAGQTEPVILLMGGLGKDEPYSPILQARANIQQVIAFGASRGAIAADLRQAVFVQEFPTLKDALVQIAGIITKQPCSVLFSPGCASFDEFRNYEERGDSFRRALGPLLDP